MKNDNKKVEIVSNEKLVNAANEIVEEYGVVLKALAAGTKEEAEEIMEKEER